MGVAIIIPGVVFTENLGKVTLAGGDVAVEVESIAISGSDTVNTSSNKATYSVAYTPINTTQKGVTWSLESGGEYATIDSIGTLTVKGSGSVTIKAVSKHNAAVTAKKVVSVVFNEVQEGVEVESIAISGSDTVNTASNKATYSVDYTPTNTTQKGVTWSLESGGEYATIDSIGTLTVKGSGSVTIKAVSKYNASVTAKKVVSVVFYEVQDTELEYIGTKGGNYLLTNTIMENGQKLILKAKLPAASNQSTAARQFILHDGKTCSIGNTYKEKIFSATLPFRQARTTAVVNGVVEFTISQYSCEFTVDGSAATITPNGTRTPSTTPVMLFSNNNSSFVHERVDMYSFRLEKDGVAVIELKPVLKDGVPCFRDTVSGNFLYITGSNSIYYATKTEPNNELTYNG
jgi:hypothetical protein